MNTKLTAKQDKFCINYFSTHNATQSAISAGYSPKTAGVIGYETLNKPQIVERLSELSESVTVINRFENEAIALKEERMRLLSEIAKHKVETPVSAGHRIQAISELNKMEHIYNDRGDTTNNTVFNIITSDERAKELLGKLGERTTKLLEG